MSNNWIVAATEKAPGLVQSRADDRLRHLLARDYVGFVETVPAAGHSLLPPSATVTIILNIGDSFGGLPDAFVAGMEETVYWLERHHGTTCIDVKLTPLGAYTILGGRPLHELTGRSVDIRELFGAVAGELVEALRQTDGWRRRFELVDGFLLRYATSGPQPSPGIVWSWRQLQQTAGGTPVRDLLEQTGWSRRHFIAKCREQLGLPPKTLARILRFNQLLKDSDAIPGRPWLDLALEHGYYDPSHLIREFREFTGMTPGEFLRHRYGT